MNVNLLDILWHGVVGVVSVVTVVDVLRRRGSFKPAANFRGSGSKTADDIPHLLTQNLRRCLNKRLCSTYVVIINIGKIINTAPQLDVAWAGDNERAHIGQ
jgi:hypothetical protein